MSYSSSQKHLFDEEFVFNSNYQFCSDDNCEHSNIYSGHIDLLRVKFSDKVKVNLFADVNQDEEDIEQRFTNPETVIIPTESKLTQSKIKVISQLMIENHFHRKLRRAFYAQLIWLS